MIGRIAEKREMKRLLDSPESELLAVYGRRRVGKTYMIRQVYKKQMVFSFSGLYEGTLEEHMEQFAIALTQYSSSNLPVKTPGSWIEAFDLLYTLVTSTPTKEKKVIFLDEVPWMATPRSRFLTAFEGFWNGRIKHDDKVVVVICGSAASWMINNIEDNRGGLYNRVTKRIVLQPFTLSETEAFLQFHNIHLSKYHITELYMILGGIPYYLKEICPGETPKTFSDRCLFDKKGSLHREFKLLFHSLFGEGNLHAELVKILAKHRSGLTREQLLTKLNMSSGGRFTQLVGELEASDFVQTYLPYGYKNKDRMYKVIDNFSIFNAKFLQNRNIKNWNNALESRSWSSWSGLSFENICHYHQKEIIHALGISGIENFVTTWHNKGNEEMSGAQIDMLIERSDKAIHICEIKFSDKPYIITKKYAKELKQKAASFMHFTKLSKRSIFFTMITANGLHNNIYSRELVSSDVILESLFVQAVRRN